MKRILKNSYFVDFLIILSCTLFMSINSVFSIDLLPSFIKEFQNKEVLKVLYSLLISLLATFSIYISDRYFDFKTQEKNLSLFIFLLVFFSVTYMLRIFTLSRMYIILMVGLFILLSLSDKYLKDKSLDKYYMYFVVVLVIFLLSSFSNLNSGVTAEDIVLNEEEKLSIEEIYSEFLPSLIGQFNINKTFELVKYTICCEEFKYVNYGQKSLGSIEIIEDNLYYFSGNMVFQKLNLKEMINSKEKITFEIIPSNIKNVVNNQNLFINNWESIKDVLFLNDKLYLSYVEEVDQDCVNIKVLSAKFPDKHIKFESFLEFDECVMRTNEVFNAHQSGGKLEATRDGMIIMSTGDFRQYDKSQNPQSIFGKIIKINPSNGEFTILALGSRNSQGLTPSKNNENIFFETEHGPKGGDEINTFNLSEQTNFGWPVSSYGTHYDGMFKEDAPLYKSHDEYGFKEPIHFFPFEIVGSHGISDIEINHFVKSNNYFVSTLNGRVLYDFLISDENKNVLEFKTYRTGERIRNIIYYEKQNLYILLLEDTPSIALLKKRN